MTGAGKSNLLHVIIVGLAMRYSPEELQMVLLDFKDGVEFRGYAGGKSAPPLPHVRVIAPQADPEFGRATLAWLQHEMTRRNDTFKRAPGDVRSIEQYRKSGEKMARILIILDEFQVLVGDDGDGGHQALKDLALIAKQGRSVGVHLILSSQTITDIRGSQFLDAMLDQFRLRIALLCQSREASMRLLGGRERTEAVKLSRHDAILSSDRSSLGRHFRIVYAEGEACQAARRQIAAAYGKAAQLQPTVFDGECLEPEEVLQKTVAELQAAAGVNSFVLGQPVAVDRQRLLSRTGTDQRGNLAIIGQNETAALGIMAASALALNRSAGWPVVLAGTDEEGSVRTLRAFLDDLGCPCAVRTWEEITQAAEAGAANTIILGVDWKVPSDRESRTALSDLFKVGPARDLHYIMWWRYGEELVREIKADGFGRRVSLDGRGDSRVQDWFPARLPEQAERRAIFWEVEEQRRLTLFVPYGLTLADS